MVYGGGENQEKIITSPGRSFIRGSTKIWKINIPDNIEINPIYQENKIPDYQNLVSWISFYRKVFKAS